MKIYIAPLQDPYSEALSTPAKKLVGLRTSTVWEGSPFQVILDQLQKKNGYALSQGVRIGPPNRRGQRTALHDGLCKNREGGKARAAGGTPTRQAPPHHGRDPGRDALWEWNPVQRISHVLGYGVKFSEPTNESCRSPVDPPQLLHPNLREISEDRSAMVKAAEHKCMNKGDSSIKSQGASNDPQLSQLIVQLRLTWSIDEGRKWALP